MTAGTGEITCNSLNKTRVTPKHLVWESDKSNVKIHSTVKAICMSGLKEKIGHGGVCIYRYLCYVYTW